MLLTVWERLRNTCHRLPYRSYKRTFLQINKAENAACHGTEKPESVLFLSLYRKQLHTFFFVVVFFFVIH